MADLIQWVRETWRATWRAASGSPVRNVHPEVVVHDPGSQRPHDLDDPFFDPAVQSRIAGVIADSTKTKN